MSIARAAFSADRFSSIRRLILQLFLLLVAWSFLASTLLGSPQAETPDDASGGKPSAIQEGEGKLDLVGDPIPFGAMVRLGSSRLIHPSSVSDQARLAPQAGALVTIGSTARVWDLADGKLRFEIEDEAAISHAVILPGGDTVALIARDYDEIIETTEYSLLVYDLNTGDRLHEHSWVVAERINYFEGFYLSRDFNRVFLIAQRRQGLLLSAHEEEPKRWFETDCRIPVSIMDTKGGVVYFTEGARDRSDESAVVWKLNLEDDQPGIEEAAKYDCKIELLNVGSKPFVAKHSDGKTLQFEALDRSESYTVALPSPIRHAHRLEGAGGPSKVVLFYFDEDSNRVQLRMDLSNGLATKLPPAENISYFPTAVDSVGGNSLYWNNFSHRYFVYDWETGKRTIPGPLAESDPIADFVFSRDEKTLFTVNRDAVREWDLASGELKRSITFEGLLRRMASSMDGKWLAVATRSTDVHLYDLDEGKVVRTLKLDAPIGGSSHGMSFSADSSNLQTFSSDNLLRTWDLESGELIRSQKFAPRLAGREEGDVDRKGVPPQAYDEVAFSEDGRYLTGVAQNDVDCLDAATGESLLVKRQGDSRLSRVVSVPFGEELPAMAFVDSEKNADGRFTFGIRVVGREEPFFYELPTADKLGYMYASLAIEPRERFLAADVNQTANQSTFRLWAFDSGKVLCELKKARSNRFYDIGFSPSGKYFAAVTAENNVLVWETESIVDEGKKE